MTFIITISFLLVYFMKFGFCWFVAEFFRFNESKRDLRFNFVNVAFRAFSCFFRMLLAEIFTSCNLVIFYSGNLFGYTSLFFELIGFVSLFELFSSLALFQLRVHARQQKRVHHISQLDRRKVPRESNYQLGCDSVGEPPPRALDHPSYPGHD